MARAYFFECVKLLTSYDSTHWASVSACSAVDASVRVDYIDVTL